ncbi:hypothetical protein ACFY3M_13530 [Streptomyces mirabilis]|uniref:hypothetical protein n=1 Tax=Streptomyces mirabilis TaxID=68239 RepID=UPI00368BA837
MPRVQCSCCRREIAAGMVAGQPGKGRLWRHDPPERRSLYGDSLVSCPGSLSIVPLPVPGGQLQLVEVEEGTAGNVDTMALF